MYYLHAYFQGSKDIYLPAALDRVLVTFVEIVEVPILITNPQLHLLLIEEKDGLLEEQYSYKFVC